MIHSDCLLDEVKLLDDIIHLLERFPDHQRHSTEYSNSIGQLETRLRKAYFQSMADLTGITATSWPNPYSLKITEANSSTAGFIESSRKHLFIAAVWIYFERAVRGLVGTSETLSCVLNDAFWLLSYNLHNQHVRSSTRHPPFALFLVGTEARNDEERRLILEVLLAAASETERWLPLVGNHAPTIGLRSASLGYATYLTERLWIRNDLHDSSAGFLDYHSSLTDAISGCEMLPSLL